MKQFTLTIDKIGEFTFRRQEMRDAFRIEAEYSRLTEGVPPTDAAMEAFTRAAATLKVMTVEAPETWNIDALDPFDIESYANVIAVDKALHEKEQSFRSERRKDAPPAGEDAQ